MRRQHEAASEPAHEEGVAVDKLHEVEQEEVLVELVVRSVGVVPAFACEVGVEDELSAELPAAQVLLQRRRAFVEAVHPDAENGKFVPELQSEFFERLQIGLGDLVRVHFRQRSGHDRRHLVARGRLGALEEAVRIAGNDAVGRQLRHRVVSPVAGRQVGEGAGGGKGSRDQNNCKNKHQNRSR